MPRIRTIKPEFPQSESVGRLSRDARLLFIQLWTICDDYGRCRGAHKLLAGQLYPYDDDAAEQLPAWLGELEREGLVRVYEVDRASFLQVEGWSRHQRIDNAGKPMVPAPDGESPRAAETRGGPRLDPDPDPDPDLGPRPRPGPVGGQEGQEPSAGFSEGPGEGVGTLQAALARTPLRSRLEGRARDAALLALAIALAPTGLTPDDVDQLDRLDQERASTRGALMAHWFEGKPPRWREALDEERERQRSGRPARPSRNGRSNGHDEPPQPRPLQHVSERNLPPGEVCPCPMCARERASPRAAGGDT